MIILELRPYSYTYGSNLIIVIEDYNKLPCPKCGKLLKGRSAGMWD